MSVLSGKWEDEPALGETASNVCAVSDVVLGAIWPSAIEDICSKNMREGSIFDV